MSVESLLRQHSIFCQQFLKTLFVWLSMFYVMPELSSSGRKCCTARSKCNLLVSTWTARTVPSGLGSTSVIIPNVHSPLFRSSLWKITISPTLANDIRSLVLMLCFSLNALLYPSLHLSHATFLHFWMYLNLFR